MPGYMNQSQKDKYYTISLIWSIYNSQINRKREYNSDHQGLGDEENGDLFNGYEAFIMWDGKF